METKNKTELSDGTENLTSEVQFSSRRKWMKRAGAAAPALLVLANRPAMAASCTISGFMSAQVGTSLTNYDANSCNGWSPGNWKNDVGEINLQAWVTAGVNKTTPFNNRFDTASMGLGNGIRRVVGGVPESGYITYQSQYSSSFYQAITGQITGNSQLKDITMHAAAAYLNASFLANGGGGLNPDPWMTTYIAPVDVVGLFLLYELQFQQATPPASSVVYRYERGGMIIAESGMDSNGYANYFVSIANGSASSGWNP